MKSSTKQYFSRLDHLRFLAAFLVLVWHATHLENTTAHVPAFWPLSILEQGHTGVALFMVLSGFIFQALCRDYEIDYFQFLRNRLLRIGPLFVVWTFFLFYTEDVDPVKFFVAVVALLNRNTVPGGAWTIIIEFQFYLIFPFLLTFTRRLGIRYLVGLLLLALLFRAGVWYSKNTVQMLAYWTIFGRLDQFILGILGCELYYRYPKILGRPFSLILLVALWLAVMHAFNLAGGFYNNGAYPSTSPIWIYFPTLEGLFYGLITAFYLALNLRIPEFVDKSLAWLGSLSFSFYLNHVFVVAIALKFFHALGWDITGFRKALLFAVLVCLPLVVLMSFATYNLIERPFLALRGNYLRPRNSGQV